MNTLNAVAGCKETLERLSITCFDSMMLGRSTRDITSYSPNVLLEEVADRFPDVKALHVVILLATCSKVSVILSSHPRILCLCSCEGHS